MGVVNVTPDSFSDGGLYLDAGGGDRARAWSWSARGRTILDVGGESTRPGARGGRARRRSCARVVPVVAALAGVGPRSRSTPRRLAVAEAALDAGAAIVNDVTALRARPRDGRRSCAERGADVVLMHMPGDPRTMQDDPRYDDVVDDVKAFLAERLEFARRGRDRRGADLARPGDRLRQDRSSTTSSCCAGSASCASSAGRSSSAPRARASSASIDGSEVERPARRHDRLLRARRRRGRRRPPRPRRRRGRRRRSTVAAAILG